MPEPKTNPTPDQRQVVAQQQPSGLPAGEAGRAQSEADANGQKQPTVTKVLREAKRDAVPVDFDFEINPQSRPAMDPMNPPEERQEQNAQSPNPIDQMANGIEIEYRGQKETIPVDAARTMLQQFKTMSGMSPIIGLANQVADKLGIKDPREVAAFIQQAIMSHVTQQGGGDPNAAAGQGGQQPPASAQQQREATPGVKQPELPPEISPEVDAAVDAFFSQNGLTPTPEVRDSMRNMIAYGKHIKEVANAFPALAADVNIFKQATQVNSQRALDDAVNARAAKVAAELGIDTQEEVQGFSGWVADANKAFPGFSKSIATNPDAMEAAVRQYHLASTGKKALAAQATQKGNVQADLARAGGDAPGGRSGGGANFAQAAKPDDQKAFEQDVMSRM